MLARHGAAGLFNSLHPGIAWSGGTLRVDSRFTVEPAVPLVIVVPSLVAARPAVAVDPVCGGRGPPMVAYPVRDRATAPAPLSAEPARLLGPTRAGLLTALTRPASTTQLAERHYLSPATVSYHLGVLHQAGLVTRARSGRTVLHRRTPAGSRPAGARQVCRTST
ncbi:ArsR/SmtB family transcription factor [Streptomyces sp. JNUCC 63]